MTGDPHPTGVPMDPVYPLSISDQRMFPDGFDGRVHVWDVDKTYLDTSFSRLFGLARIPFEFAVDKRAVSGMPEILRGLRTGPGPGYQCVPLYFITASPPQLRAVIERKMLMDGVEYDGVTFKDWVGVLLSGSPGRLREQVGFKLCALLTGRLGRPMSREILVGDDVERDAEAFHLYARILAGDLSAGEAEKALEGAGVSRQDRQCVAVLLDRLGPRRGSVERIFIHLAAGSPPERFAPLAPLVVPVAGAAQLTKALRDMAALPTDVEPDPDRRPQ